MGNLKKNYLYRLLYEILTMITPLITTPYVSRILGADGIGIYSYTYSYVTYFIMFAALGTSSLGEKIRKGQFTIRAFEKILIGKK